MPRLLLPALTLISTMFLAPSSVWSEEVVFSAAPTSAPSVPAKTELFSSRDGALKKNVDFWVSIYSQYYTHQGLIHDAKYIDKVYEVIEELQAGTRASQKTVRNAKKKWKDVLLSVHRKRDKPEQMNEEELKVFKMFEDVQEPNKFAAAAHRKRMRVQIGQKDRFEEGLRHSGRYLPIMEEIFKREGLPVELTRLPFVESSFNIRARSKVGASGIWQFMRSTGRMFLKINDAVDERNDPIRATEAAAKLLKQNYDSLQSWPLAVTAYNHGRMGMMRAVRKVGSDDLEEVISGYRSRSFGFASGNFYTELMAAIEVEKNAEKYFGAVDRAKPQSYVETELPHFISMKELSRFLSLDASKVKDLNPGLSESVYQGKRLIPKGYRLRLPHPETDEKETTTKLFLAGYDQIPQMFKLRGQSGGTYDRGLTTDKPQKRKKKRH